MADIDSGLPIRTQVPAQVNYDDVIIKIGDATSSNQLASVDANGSLQSRLADAAGNIMGSQLLSTTYWLQSVMPSNGPAAPGTAAAFSDLAGAIFTSTTGLSGSPLTAGQQAALQVNANGYLLIQSASLLAEDHNWGTVGANTLRTAAEIGNAAGAADFNYGTVGAQTLRAAAQLGNATGPIDYNFGAADAQTIRTAALIGNATGAADFNYGAVGAQTLRIASQIGNATGAADFNNGATTAQTLRTAANLAVGGANVSATNPVPVSFSSAPLGTVVNNYNTVAAVAAGATSNHIYTITALKTFQGKKVWGSASGLLKIEVRVSPDGSTYSTLWVGFNSAADPNITVDMDQMVFLESGTGATIEVIRTNLDKKAMDVYSTISGTEV